MATNSRELYKLPKKVTSVEGFIDDGSESLITAEMRAYMSKFSDPLSLNFKLMVDYDKSSGLFAPDTVTDSALAYLKRIGENERYNMLLRWISVFQQFIKNFDFLIEEVEGIDEIVNHKTGDMYNDEAKISINIRETSDMLIQSILTTWRHIWFDDIRCVEVLPSNLRKFDLNILIYNSGYYNMTIYDSIESQFFNKLNKEYDKEGNEITKPEDYQKKMFPTIKKLSDKYFIENAKKYDFNHHLIMMKGVSINNEESGKSFFTTLSNEMSGDGVKNVMVLDFRFARYKGTFNNIMGEFDFVDLLVLAAVENKRMSIMSEEDFRKETGLSGNNTDPYIKQAEKTKNKFKDYLKNAGESFKQTGIDTIKELKSKPAEYSNNLVGPNSVIGNAIETLTDPTMLSKMVKNTVDLGISYVEDKYINGFISKANSLVMNNFSENFVDVYKKYFEEKPSQISLIENTVATDTQIGNGVFDSPGIIKNDAVDSNVSLIINEPITQSTNGSNSNYPPGTIPNDLQKGIRLEQSNIYKRGGF